MAENNLYTTGELASACGVTVRTVQYYDSKKLLTPSGYSEGGRRLYTEDDASKLRFILMLKNMGLGLTQIRGVLESSHREAILQTLLDEQAALIQEELDENKQRLDAVNMLRSDIKLFGTILTTDNTAVVHRMDRNLDSGYGNGNMVAISPCAYLGCGSNHMAGKALQRSCNLSLSCLQNGIQTNNERILLVGSYPSHQKTHLPSLRHKGLVCRALLCRSA